MDADNLSSAKSNVSLQYGFTAQEVVRFIKTLDITPSDNLDLMSIPTTNVGIGQIAVRHYNSLPDYIREMNMIVSQGVNQRAHIICFPAFAGFLPASLFPQYEKVVKNIQYDIQSQLPSSMWINQAVSALASECFEVYFATMSALASAYNVYIMAGSSVYPENGTFTHRALLFDPNGNLLGYQDKLISTPLEDALRIEPAGKLKVFDTPIGKLSMIIGNDADYFEIAKVAYHSGVRILLNPAAFMSYDNVDASCGLNLRVQEYPMYGVQSTLIGETDLGFQLKGPSGVFAPMPLASPTAKNGMFVSSIKQTQTQVVSARLSLDAPDTLKFDALVNNNPLFLEKYIDSLY